MLKCYLPLDKTAASLGEGTGSGSRVVFDGETTSVCTALGTPRHDGGLAAAVL